MSGKTEKVLQHQILTYMQLDFSIVDIMNNYLCCAFLSVMYSRLSPPWPNFSVCAAGAPTVTISYSVPAAERMSPLNIDKEHYFRDVSPLEMTQVL